MTLAAGTRLGPYEVAAPIGVGGMGEVYRATDTNLGRQVAIKVLPEAFADDQDRLARFAREAKTLASLNHPNIAQLHGLERSGGMSALVMELVEGPTLADRIAQGAIPIEEALPIAKQIAEALEAAHEQGIIHRDLKPANIKVRPDGTVKVLDFGLAKAMEPVGAMSPGVSQSVTITSPAMMTGVGMILGTAAYMSPEQARGKTVDRRTDIWALGCVLFEMLVGRRAFAGDEVSDTLASVLAREPDWALLPPSVPPVLGTYLRRCLQKDLKQRIHDVADVRLALEGAFEVAGPPTGAAASSPAPPGGRFLWMAVLGVAAALIVVLAIPALRHLRETPTPSPPETRLEIVTPATDQPASMALSPDGRQIVFVASGEGGSRLWLRSLASTTAQPLAGTEGARDPFWSPDSRSIGFFAVGELRRLDLGGGAPQRLASASAARGGTWSGADGVIVFAPSATDPLMRVSASGGAAVAVTTLGPQQQGHLYPHFLPDGRRFLFYVNGPETQGIYFGGLDGGPPTRLTATNGPGMYLPSGWLVWGRAGALVAQRLDVAQAVLTGELVTLADGVAVDTATSRSAMSVSATGLVAYRTGGAGRRQLAWFDRSGKALGGMGAPDENELTAPELSPDGRRVVAHRTVQNNTDVWILDDARTVRVTSNAASDRWPIWSPDGSRIVFDSNRKMPRDLYQRPLNSGDSEELLLESPLDKAVMSWSGDGHFLLYRVQDPKTQSDLWVLPMDGNRKPFLFLSTPFDERTGVFSPDGHWVAYQQSNESGQWEIYVRPFPGPGAQSQVSTSGGIQPRWRPDGKELYYIAPDGKLMAAAIAARGSPFDPGVPVALFLTRIWGGGTNSTSSQQYDVASDGRFLINTELGDAAVPITVLQNWNPDEKK